MKSEIKYLLYPGCIDGGIYITSEDICIMHKVKRINCLDSSRLSKSMHEKVLRKSNLIKLYPIKSK